MELTRIKANFFKTPSGNEPVREWLKTHIQPGDSKLIGADIKTVEYGWPVGMPTCESMGGGLFQVRTDLPNNRISRVLFCVEDGIMHLLHGFIKKDQKTPKPDLDLAKSRLKILLKELTEPKKGKINLV